VLTSAYGKFVDDLSTNKNTLSIGKLTPVPRAAPPLPNIVGEYKANVNRLCTDPHVAEGDYRHAIPPPEPRRSEMTIRYIRILPVLILKHHPISVEASPPSMRLSGRRDCRGSEVPDDPACSRVPPKNDIPGTRKYGLQASPAARAPLSSLDA
jgi:hypothetical protein